MSRRTHLTATATALAAAATTAVIAGTTTPAHAGSCRTIAGSLECGGVRNSTSSPKNVPYTLNWRTSGGQIPSGSLAPGQAVGGRGTGTDVDGYYIPPNCVGYGGTSTSGQTSGWYKIADITNATITLYC
jgi:hypothetical protein